MLRELLDPSSPTRLPLALEFQWLAPFADAPSSGRKACLSRVDVSRITPALGFLCLVALLDVELLVMTMFFVFQGRKAKDIINTARASLAKMIGGKPQDIIFTSGGTEVKLLSLLPEPKGTGRVGAR